MHKHPLWRKVSQILSKGTDYPLRPISEQDRKRDVRAALKYGNHRSINEKKVQFASNMTSEIKQGWSLPLPPHFALHLPQAEVAPHGIVSQHTITNNGEIVDKDRVTHDQSFPGEFSKESINSRVIDDDLAPCMFGHMHLRCTHYIVGCRMRHPHTKVFISKVDWKSAYRRQHYNGRTATKSLTQVIINGLTLLLMALRLTFGGKPCPSEWSCISESVTDLANDILSCPDWDPEQTHAPDQAAFPRPRSLPDNIPFAQAKATIVAIPIEDDGKCDVYIDDMVTMGPDLPGLLPRLSAAMPLSIHIFFRPLDKVEHLLRNLAISASKLQAEGRLEELKTLLGWLYNTRKLLISLPTNKFIAWSKDIRQIIKSKQSTFKELETLVGRCNHAAYVIPTARHFLSRIRALKTSSRFRRITSIPKHVITDLQLWLDFLKSAHNGISMNLLTYRLPTHVFRSDACEHGLGGYSASGKAWRLQFPKHLLSRAHINLLEFIASIICIWIDVLDDNIPPDSCLLSMGDNTSAVGWMKKSNFKMVDEDDQDNTAKITAARKLARLIQASESLLYSQYFPGEDNDVSDCLSRDFNLTNIQLSHLLSSIVPNQLPDNFRIVPLPAEIVSWVFSLLEKLPVKMQRQVAHKNSALATSPAGKNSLAKLESSTTTSSPPSMSHGTAPSSSLHLHKQCGKPASLQQLTLPWLKQQSEPPSTTWHRPSGLTTGQTHAQMTTESSLSFYNNNSKVIKTRTRMLNNKRRSHSA